MRARDDPYRIPCQRRHGGYGPGYESSAARTPLVPAADCGHSGTPGTGTWELSDHGTLENKHNNPSWGGGCSPCGQRTTTTYRTT